MVGEGDHAWHRSDGSPAVGDCYLNNCQTTYEI